MREKENKLRGYGGTDVNGQLLSGKKTNNMEEPQQQKITDIVLVNKERKSNAQVRKG